MNNEEIAELYESGLSTLKIGVMLNVNAETIRARLIKQGVKIRKRKHNFDTSKFTFLDSETAYWLGFIYADGNIYKDTLSIKLGMVDKSHIEKFRSFMSYTGKVEMQGEYPRIRIYSDELCENLLNFGIHPNKSKTLIYPELNGYDRDFIRGFFDGDGWRNIPYNIGLCSCSESFVRNIKKVLNDGIDRNVGSVITRKSSKGVNSYTLSFGGSLVIKALNEYLWYDEDVLCLQRKSAKVVENYLKELEVMELK